LNEAFRKAQKGYLAKLRGKVGAREVADREVDDEDLDAVFMDSQVLAIATNERAITEREKVET
jgi:hypothetical protein